MTSSNSSNKWKDALLRSSLPLEHLIAQKLSDLGIYISGEYTYLRPNEKAVNTEFSADLWAFKFLEENIGNEDLWSCCNFLIECKYAHRSVKWLFSPHPKDDESLENGYINIFQDFCVKRIDERLLANFDKELKYCIKGIEIHEKDCNPNTISKGLNQLQYASIQLSKQCMGSQICTSHDDNLHIDFLCPILVTTAPLYVFKENLSLDDFYGAKSIEDVADEEKFLIIHQNNGVQKGKYIKAIKTEFLENHKEAGMRLKEMSEILSHSDYNGYHIPDVFFLGNKFGCASTRILIVSYEYFNECIKDILSFISNTTPTLKQYATLKYDRARMQSSVFSL